MKRTREQKEANSLDLSLFNVMSRVRAMSYDKTLSRADRSAWYDIYLELLGARPLLRMRMHPDDVRETSEGTP